MPKTTYLLIFLAAQFFLQAQDRFKAGSIWWTQTEVSEVEILDEDWVNTPFQIQYKQADQEAASINLIAFEGFQIGDEIKMKKFKVAIEQSSNITAQLSESKEPSFVEKTVFLSYVLEGEISLLEYVEDNRRQFYLQLGNANPQPLIYKRYSPRGAATGENKSFQDSLFKYLSAANLSQKEFFYLNYNRDQLKALMIKYHKRLALDFQNYDRKGNKSRFHFGLKASFRYQQMSVLNPTIPVRPIDYTTGIESSYTIGLSLEWVIPVNNGRWSVLAEASYYELDDRYAEIRFPGSVNEREVEYLTNFKNLEVPVLIRRYWFLSGNHRLFMNLGLLNDIPLNSTYTYPGPQDALDLSYSLSPLFGMGYQYRNISIELRGNYYRSFLNIYRNWRGEYNSLSLCLNYNLL